MAGEAVPADEEGASEGPDLVLLTVLVVGVILALAVGGQLLHPGSTVRNTSAVQVSLAAAYIGGLLAFLSPCSVAVIPGFFTYSFDTRGSLIRHTYVFYLGLALVFVPLGFGASLVGQALRAHQMLLSVVTGAVMVGLGLLLLSHVDLFGWLGRFGGTTVSPDRSETGRVFALGAFFGLATSSCTAPILAGITVLSVGAGLAPIESMLLFMVFALGIVTPLFPLAWAGDRTEALEKLKGGHWTLEVGDRTLRLSRAKVLAGLALIAIGVLFIATNGTRGLLGLYDAVGATELYETLDARVRELLGGALGWILSIAALVVVGVWAWRRQGSG